jgi:hypothetical protein
MHESPDMVTGLGSVKKLLVSFTTLEPHVDDKGGRAVEDGQRMMPHVGAIGHALAGAGDESARAAHVGPPSLA